MTMIKDNVATVDHFAPKGRQVSEHNATEHPASTDLQRDDQDVGMQPQGGLPRHIAGGFRGVADDLDRRSRDWTMMVRLLEQQRLHLETAENERERLYIALNNILPDVKETTDLLEATIERTKAGDVSANLSALFSDNLRALDELENIGKALTANLLWSRSSWEQYARSVIGAHKMREEIKS